MASFANSPRAKQTNQLLKGLPMLQNIKKTLKFTFVAIFGFEKPRFHSALFYAETLVFDAVYTHSMRTDWNWTTAWQAKTDSFYADKIGQSKKQN